MSRKKKSTNEVVFPNLHQNWRYSSGVDYDYDSYRDCEANGCDGICRCERLMNLRVTSVDVNCFARNVCKEMKLTDSTEHQILEYCIDRLLRLHRVYESNAWDLSASMSYYGEEVNSVRLDSSIASNLGKDIAVLLATENPIEFILQKEYDFLLPELIGQKWTVDSVPFKNIHLGAVRHMQKINQEASKIYANYTGVLAVCLPAEDEKEHYRVIDGYHRVTTMQREHPKTRIAKIIVPC